MVFRWQWRQLNCQSVYRVDMEDIAVQLFNLGDQEHKGFIVKRDMQVSWHYLLANIWLILIVATKQQIINISTSCLIKSSVMWLPSNFLHWKRRSPTNIGYLIQYNRNWNTPYFLKFCLGIGILLPVGLYHLFPWQMSNASLPEKSTNKNLFRGT